MLQFRRIVRLLFELPNRETALQHLETLLRYAVSAAEHTNKEALHTIIIELFEEEGDDIMPTIAEQLIEQGRAEGEAKVREAEQKVRRSEQKARQSEQKAKQAFNKTIRQTLVIRFQTKLEQYDEQLNQLNLLALETLSDLVFSTETLTEFETKLSSFSMPPPNEDTSLSDKETPSQTS